MTEPETAVDLARAIQKRSWRNYGTVSAEALRLSRLVDLEAEATLARSKADADLIGNLRRALYTAATSVDPQDAVASLDHEAGVAFIHEEAPRD